MAGLEGRDVFKDTQNFCIYCFVVKKQAQGPIPGKRLIEDYFRSLGDVTDVYLPAKNPSVAYIEFTDPVHFLNTEQH